jgi:hypothetical protein
MDVVLGTFLLLFSLDGFCTFACGALAGILHLYAWSTLISFRPFASSLPFHFNLQLSTSRRSILLFEFRDEFFSRTRERRVIGCCMDRFTLPDAMAFLDEQVSLATSYLSAAISCLTCFDALHASTSSDDFNSAHIDVQV